MKLATTTSDFYEYSLSQQEKMNHVAKAGFKYLDYSFGTEFDSKTGVFSIEKDAYIEDIKRHCERLGVKYVQAHAPMGSPIIKNDEHTALVNGTKTCIEACARLGIPNIVVHSGYQWGISREETFERNKEFYGELLPCAEKYGVNILTENFNVMCVDGMYWIDNATDLRALIDYVDHPLFHACWDAGHANMQDMPQHEELALLGEHVLGIHVQDNLQNDDHHLAPFMGSLSIDSLMNGLINIGYKGYFTFEANNIFCSAWKRRKFEQDDRLLKVPLELKTQAERMLYLIGKHILTSYDMYEE